MLNSPFSGLSELLELGTTLFAGPLLTRLGFHGVLITTSSYIQGLVVKTALAGASLTSKTLVRIV